MSRVTDPLRPSAKTDAKTLMPFAALCCALLEIFSELTFSDRLAVEVPTETSLCTYDLNISISIAESVALMAERWTAIPRLRVRISVWKRFFFAFL